MKKFIFLMCLCLLPLSASASTIGRPGNYLALSTGLVGYWPLDGNTTSWTTNKTSDLSGQGNTGTLVNMSTTTSPMPGKIGGALKFNGNANWGLASRITTNYTAQLNDFTACAWFNQQDSGGTSGYNRILDKHYTAGFWIGEHAADGTFGGGIEQGTAPYGIFVSVGHATKQWHYLCMSRSGTTETIYLDGKFGTSGTVSGTAVDTTALSIGNTTISGDGSGDFNGRIDDARIYNRALSASEVAALYNLGATNIAHSNTVALASGLIGYWPLDGNTTSWTTNKTSDLSGQGNTGTLVNMSTTTSPMPGKIGGALKFNGSTQYINMGNATPLKITGALTMSAWVKYATTTPGTAQIIMSKYDALSNQRGYSLGVDASGKLNCNVQAAAGTFDATSAVLSTATWYDNKWHDVTCIYSPSSQLRIYVDGVLASGDAATIPSSIANNTASFLMGAINQSTATQFFPGSIDDARIYNRALSVSEVRALYNLGAANVAHSNTTQSTSGLVGDWSLDGSKTSWTTDTTQDSSGQGNTGQLISMSTTTSPVPGKIGGALNFNGTSGYMSLGASNKWTFTTSSSISAWVKTTNAAQQRAVILERAVGSTAQGIAWGEDVSGSNTSSGKPVGRYRTGSGPGAAIGSTAINDGKWHFITWVISDSNGTLYVDGVSSATVSDVNDANTFANSADIASIGASGSPASFFWSGSIDDVRIYNRALSASEVQTLYNAGK